MIDYSKVPAYLKDRAQWVMWRSEKRGDKTTKVPYQPNGQCAKSTDSSTWSDFQTCLGALKSGKFSGIGFAFTEGDGLAGIDLDHCFDTYGNLEQWAQDVVEQFPETYIERSPGGDGLHIWCFGKPVRTGSKKWKKPGTDIDQGIEVYNYTSPRYLTVTGAKL